MIDLTDLGLVPVTSAATSADAQVVSNDRPHGTSLVPGSTLARVLYAAFSREPVTIIDSPPGAGKSTLVIDVLERLLRDSHFKIVVAAPTRRGALDLAGRLVDRLGDSKTAPAVVVPIKDAIRPPGTFAGPPATRPRHITVRTIESCTHSAPNVDLIVFDEAYQATYSQIAAAADDAAQIIMVGDPGQIGPVVTQDTSPWETRRDGPHHRAPEVFARRSDATVFRMDATYRLGQPTVEAIAPLYGFPFASKRPERYLVDATGSRIPEITSMQIEPTERTGTMSTSIAAADAAVSLLARRVVTPTDPDGSAAQVVRDLGQGDVAVVASHGVQVTNIQAVLRSRGFEGIAVGTADSLQGGQWHAVVALDPLLEHTTVSDFQVAPGRLCVMASRHMSHLTWVHDGREFAKLDAVADQLPDAKVGIAVRRHLITQ